MEFVIWVETRIADRTVDRQEVANIERPPHLHSIGRTISLRRI
jgi:hypothetical protein